MEQCMAYTEKLTKALKKAERGEKLKIGFLGGSITQGCNPTDPQNAYVERVTRWLKERFPKAEIERINAGVGATGSLIGLHRVGRDIIQYQPDIVIVEFAANDIPPKEETHLTYECLIRKLLKSLKDAAIVELFMTTVDGTNAQKEEREIADYYKLPRVSYADEIFEQIKLGTYKWEDIETDEVHPNDRGHGIVAGLVCDLFEYAVNKEVDEAYAYDMPQKPLFTDRYEEGKLIECQNLNIIEEEGFVFSKQGYRTINTGYEANLQAERVYLRCEIEARNIFLFYVRGIEGDRAKVKVTINGKAFGIIDTTFDETWGNCCSTLPLVSGDKKQSYTIELELPEEEKGKRLTLLGFLAS